MLPELGLSFIYVGEVMWHPGRHSRWSGSPGCDEDPEKCDVRPLLKGLQGTMGLLGLVPHAVGRASARGATMMS